MGYYVAVKTAPDKWKHFLVEKEVYVYISQLEAYINYPERSRLKELYPEKFKIQKYNLENPDKEGNL